MAAEAIICGVVAVGGVALTAVAGPFPVLIVTQDMRGVAGFDGSVYPVLWWAMGALLAALALAYLLLVSPDLTAGMAWLAVVLLAGEILSFLGGIRLSPLAPLLLWESAPRWNIATGLMFHYWGLSTLSVLVAATVCATLNGVHY
ncbi:MAG: hypothetical protein GXX83_05305 [Gaiellales bacterium]|nr:hypothetical protein [Gaiellales bacterium]